MPCDEIVFQKPVLPADYKPERGRRPLLPRKAYESIQQLKRVIELDPNFAIVYPSMANSYMQLSRYDEVLACAAKYGQLSRRPMEAKLIRAEILAAKGDAEEARLLLDEIESDYKGEALSLFRIAVVHSLLGEIDLAFEWLDRAYDEHDPSIMLTKVEPELEGVRGDPRYLRLLEKVGLVD